MKRYQFPSGNKNFFMHLGFVDNSSDYNGDLYRGRYKGEAKRRQNSSCTDCGSICVGGCVFSAVSRLGGYDG